MLEPAFSLWDFVREVRKTKYAYVVSIYDLIEQAQEVGGDYATASQTAVGDDSYHRVRAGPIFFRRQRKGRAHGADLRGFFGNFKSGEFVRWDVRFFGELSPSAESVPDLDKAARNSRGMVEYATRATLIMPVEASRGNGALLLDVPNRGRPIALSLFNSPRNVVVPFGSFDQGTGFLQDAGYTVAAVSWELGHGVELPTFKDAEVTTRYIESTAFAIIRDVANFLGSASADSVGTRNPLVGEISRTLALGYSQTGRFLKSFLVRGYNSVEGPADLGQYQH